MTTKKFTKYLEKQCKEIINFSLEPIFDGYIARVNAKRVGVVYQDKFYVLNALTFQGFRQIMPDAQSVNLFDWGYYRLVEVPELENTERLKQIVTAVYNDLYFDNEFVMDISSFFYSYQNYPDLIEKTYDLHITFLRFCYEKGLLQMNFVDSKDRILKMHFTNEDLTESGHKIVPQLHRKWLVYNDKNDSRSATRLKDVKKLEKYYQELV